MLVVVPWSNLYILSYISLYLLPFDAHRGHPRASGYNKKAMTSLRFHYFDDL